MEQWFRLKGYEGKYEISSLSNVRSLYSYVPKTKKFKIRHTPYQMKKRENKDGYLTVCLSLQGKSRHLLLHRLVAVNFIPNTLNLKEVNHINGVKSDNRVENLEWCTRGQNNTHAIRAGLHPGHAGEINGGAKLTNQQAIEIRNSTERVKDLIKKYKVCQTTIYDIKRGRKYACAK